ncbi:MAG: SMC-Scp complex subunit ScpB [Phycisphaerales bacterium]|nr:MAG: SMC-Scp complex subunit ScpB [Phycisphaerales bacterium]
MGEPMNTTDTMTEVSPATPGEETNDAAETEASTTDSSAEDSRDEPCAELPLATRIEALLISTDRQLSEARLAELLGVTGKGSAKVIRDAVAELNEHYESTGRSFRAERLAGGWQLLTESAFGPLLQRLHQERQNTRLSQAALETLAIIAYRQPIMRAEIEAIRGVACGEVLRGLMERRLVKITGRAEELGRPMLYGTTADFLRVFGLAGLDDLPNVKDLRPAKPAAPEAKADSSADEPDESPVEGASHEAAEPDAEMQPESATEKTSDA